MRKISATVKGYKSYLISELMNKGITQFEIDTNDITCGITFIVKQAIKPSYTETVVDYFNTLKCVEEARMFMAPRPGNAEYKEAVVSIRLKESYE